MPYPASFHRLVAIGSIYSDIFNFTMSIVPVGGSSSLGAVTQDLCDDVAGAVSNWFSSSSVGINIFPFSKLTSVKLNRIDASGHYQDPDTIEHVFSSPVSGGGPSSTYRPAQLSISATLRTGIPRGRASKGRIYFPPCVFMDSLGADGRLTQANATSYATATRTLLQNIDGVYIDSAGTLGYTGAVGVASKEGLGAFREVTEVSVGRVVDTIRSRRSSLDEDHQSVSM